MGAEAETQREPGLERVTVIVAARNEADRIGATLDALARAFADSVVWVADDASTDGTAEEAMRHGARVVSRRRPHGKGANMTAAAEAMLTAAGSRRDDDAGRAELGSPGVVLLCDGDLGESAARLAPLVAAVADGSCELAIAAFARRVGGGFGIALSFSRWATRRLAGVELGAPISGQRAIRAAALADLLPFARGYGMETAMNIDAARAGLRIREIELDLAHRATGRTLGGFVHRGRQLIDFARVYLARRRATPRSGPAKVRDS